RVPELVHQIGSEGDRAAVADIGAKSVDRGKPMSCRQRDDQRTMNRYGGARCHDQAAICRAGEGGDRALDLAGVLHIDRGHIQSERRRRGPDGAELSDPGGITGIATGRTGVWERTTFRIDPIGRLQRTGLAALVTIYGARSTAEAMIARVRRMHDRIVGLTPAGKPYRANDPELLNWVQGTAAYGFLQAYHSYVRPLSDLERDRYYAEATLAASLYGANAPTSEVVLEMRFEAIANQLERSEILFDFLAIMRSAPILPLP